MKDFIKDKAFWVGFIIGILAVISGNIFSFFINFDAMCFDCYETWGFPFAIYESGTMSHLSRFIWAGVVANFFLTVVFSFILGLIFKFIWSKFQEETLK